MLRPVSKSVEHFFEEFIDSKKTESKQEDEAAADNLNDSCILPQWTADTLSD